MYRKLVIFVISLFASTNVFGDDLFTFLPDTTVQNACVFQNLGSYTGPVTLVPVYEDISAECDPGYYLPKESETCVLCDENSYCEGGTFAYSDSEPQGINDCPNGLVAPTGTISADLCGKIMHVGDDIIYLTSVKQTTPALNVRVNDTVYYAKLTPITDGEKAMNINTNRSLKVSYDNVEYSVHDNTVQ